MIALKKINERSFNVSEFVHDQSGGKEYLKSIFQPKWLFNVQIECLRKRNENIRNEN